MTEERNSTIVESLEAIIEHGTLIVVFLEREAVTGRGSKRGPAFVPEIGGQLEDTITLS